MRAARLTLALAGAALACTLAIAIASAQDSARGPEDAQAEMLACADAGGRRSQRSSIDWAAVRASGCPSACAAGARCT